MLKFALLVAFICTHLFALTPLETNYYIKTKNILLSDIIQGESSQTILYTLERGKITKRIKSKELLKKLTLFGHKEFISKHSYTQFTLKSPIDTSPINESVRSYYKEHYQDIKISKITVNPRVFMQTLPKEYTVKIKSKNYLKSSGVLSIMTNKHKTYFFNYTIKAKIPVLFARKNISRKSELTIQNIIKKSILLDNFRALPLQKLHKAALQSKYKITKGKMLTTRDVSTLLLVKRGAILSVLLQSDNMSITFMAKAHQDGSLGDTINAIKHDGRKIAVVVTGKNQARVK